MNENTIFDDNNVVAKHAIESELPDIPSKQNLKKAPKKNAKVLKAVAIGTGIMAGVGVATAATLIPGNEPVEPENDVNQIEDHSEAVPKHEQSNHENHEQKTVTSDPHAHTGEEPSIHIDEVGVIEVDGEGCGVALVSAGKSNGVILDIDNDGKADMIWLDVNGNGEMEDDECMSLVDRNVSMQNLERHEGGDISLREAGLITTDEMVAMRDMNSNIYNDDYDLGVHETEDVEERESIEQNADDDEVHVIAHEPHDTNEIDVIDTQNLDDDSEIEISDEPGYEPEDFPSELIDDVDIVDDSNIDYNDDYTNDVLPDF